MTAFESSSLLPFFAPASIAVLGASDDPSRIGGRPIDYLRRGGYAGRVWPINPNRATVQGLPAKASILELDEAVDLAVIALPAALLPHALTECGRRGVKACVIFSAGFAEAGAEGQALQAEMLSIAREFGMRLVGPNCLGIFSTSSKLYVTFTSTFEQGMPLPGSLSIVSQSGAFGSHLYYLARKRRLGLNHWVTTGNECDIEVAEVLRWLARDESTRTILLQVEGVRDGALFVEGLELARQARKPVIVMKSGRSPVGAAAVTSHTAALAGEAQVHEAVFRQFGACTARTAEELVDVAYAAEIGEFPRGKRLGLVTISGGVGAIMADTAEDKGLDVAPMPPSAQQDIKRRLPFAAAGNPVDFTAQAFNDMGLISESLDIMLEQGGYDSILAYLTSIPGVPKVAEALRAALARVRDAHPARPLVLSMLVPDAIVAAYEAGGFPVFEDPSRAVGAIAALAEIQAAFDREADHDAEGIETIKLPKSHLGESQARELLSAAGVPVIAADLVHDAQAAATSARRFGVPVAMKVDSPDVMHKTEIGGVVLNVESPEEAVPAYELLHRRFAKARPEGRWNGVLVSPMMEGGLEVILGVKRDPVFGPVVMLGLGGIFAELLKDVTFRRAPFGEAEARRMIAELRAAPVLRGVRGSQAWDIDALANCLARFSRLAASLGEEIESLEVNPFLLLPEGEGGMALDALIVPSGEEGSART